MQYLVPDPAVGAVSLSVAGETEAQGVWSGIPADSSRAQSPAHFPEPGTQAPPRAHCKQAAMCPHPAGLPALGTGKWPAPPSPAGATSCPPSPQAREGTWELFWDATPTHFPAPATRGGGTTQRLTWPPDRPKPSSRRKDPLTVPLPGRLRPPVTPGSPSVMAKTPLPPPSGQHIHSFHFLFIT